MKRILIFHNQLWSQYKSCIFEGLNQRLEKGQLMVLQTSICEEMRKDLVDFDQHTYPYNYPYKLLNNGTLEKCNTIITMFSWIGWVVRFKPHAVNLTGYSELGTLPVLLLCKVLGVKTFITNESVLGSQHTEKSLPLWFKFHYKKLLFSLTTGFFSYGINSNLFLFYHGVPKNKIQFFLNSFDKSKFLNAKNDLSISPTNKYILFVGRLSPEKNLEAVTGLGSYIQSNQLPYEIIVIGDGPLKKAFLTQILNLPILYKGSVQWNDLADYYKNAAALFLPSIIEPWGMVANEAQELGIPVICSKSCGCADDLIISNFSGLVLEDLDYSLMFNFIDGFNNKAFIEKNATIFSLERLIDSMQKSLV
jgi:glycosyltransferase involved in cell wall biosynthesis